MMVRLWPEVHMEHWSPPSSLVGHLRDRVLTPRIRHYSQLRKGGNTWGSLISRMRSATTFMTSKRRETRPWGTRTLRAYL